MDGKNQALITIVLLIMLIGVQLIVMIVEMINDRICCKFFVAVVIIYVLFVEM